MVEKISIKKFKNCAVIFDESHYAMNLDQTLERSFTELGINSALQGDKSTL